MLQLRRGKAKSILENSINSALTAVETFNKPRMTFRIENYIILMIVAWTKLFHAYFQCTIGEKYFYKEKNGRYKIVDGERKAWELAECIKKYKQLSPAVEANIKFFIGIRNKIEHRYWDSSSLDILLFGECQALLYNYENLLVNLFGEEYSLNTCLAYALQFSHLRASKQLEAQRDLLSKDMVDIKRYIDKYKTNLPQEIFDSQEYSIKLLQIPKVSNTNRSDLSVEFVNWNSLSENDRQTYEKITTLIKDKLVIQNASNFNMLKPKKVLSSLKEKSEIEITSYEHTQLWKAFGIRPHSNSDDKFNTNDKFCRYDEPHNDYVYTEEWVNFIINLFKNYDFKKENLIEKCKQPLRIDDYI